MIINLADQKGFFTKKLLIDWSDERFNQVIMKLKQEGLIWVDKKSKKSETLYFFLGNLN